METTEPTRQAFPKPEKRIRDPKALAAYKRAHPICQACGKRRADDVHHLRSRQMGGSDIPENLVSLDRRCHQEWADVGKTRREWLAKYERTMTAETIAKVRAALRLTEDAA